LEAIPRRHGGWLEAGEDEIDVGRIQEIVGDTEIDVPTVNGQEATSWLATYRLEHVVDRCANGGYWLPFPALLWRFSELFQDRGAEGLRVGLPASRAVPAGVQAAFWMRWIETCRRTPVGEAPVILFDGNERSEDGPRLWLSFRGLAVHDLSAALGFARPLDGDLEFFEPRTPNETVFSEFAGYARGSLLDLKLHEAPETILSGISDHL
ncbi:MAG: hypothetical protein AAF517_24855, partial [Planctomycetota bacterium]